MTYILRESELTTDNQLEELVKFLPISVARRLWFRNTPHYAGWFDMLLSMSIDESARILCCLEYPIRPIILDPDGRQFADAVQYG